MATTEKAENYISKALRKICPDGFDPKEYEKYVPALLVFGNNVYRMSTWKELLKVFYYLCDKSSQEAHELLMFYRDKWLIQAGDKLIGYIDGVRATPFHVNGKYNFTSSLFQTYEGVKFSKDGYVSCYPTKRFNTRFGVVFSYASENLALIMKIADILRLKKVEFYLSDSSFPSEQVEKEKAALVEKLTDKKRTERVKEKNTKYLIAHINGEVLSKEEKFYKHIDTEFQQKPFLGDIVITEEEESYLHSYMQDCIKRFSKMEAQVKITSHPKVFAFGLVRYAMKYYGKKTFWPYFEKEFGVVIKPTVQGEIHDAFRLIMKRNQKLYDDQSVMKIDNISMHCFVTDSCADQLFDYIFDFWRLDLNRNIENIYGKEGKLYFDRLVDEIKSNNDVAVNNIMKHTSMALAMQPKSGRMRLKRILQMMDSCFWNHTEIPKTGNRFNELLRAWMSVKDGKFQTEYKIAQIGKALRGSTLLSRPQLCVSRETERFFLRFPREILAHCSDSGYPKWYVQTEDKCKVFTVDFLEGRIGRYTEECEKAFPTELLFQKIKLTLLSDERTYQTYRIPASDLRFFNERGVGTDWRSGTVSPGNWIVYSTSKEVPQVLYREPTVPSVFDGNIYRCIYDLRDGDIVKFPNGFAVAVGRSISEGLNGKPLKGVRVGRNNERIDLFTDFPQIIVKADRAQLSGGFLKIRGEQCTERFLRLSETACEELRLDVSSEDIEAYAVDLSQYISDSDIYELEVNLPNSKTNRFYRFAYLKDFSFEFIDAPYLFCEAGVIRFPSSTPIEAKSEWEISLTGKSLPFSFDPDSDYGKDVEGTQLILQYRLKDRAIRLCFDIPAFFWKYEKDGEWNYQRPADITIKRLPQYLYVCGPFDFGSKVTKLNVDKVSFDDFESTDIYAEKVAGEECYRFHLANAKSWMDRSSVKRMIYVTLGGKTYDLIKVQCRSDCISASIYADHDAGALHGKLEIIGDSEYSVKVERNGEKLGDDIPLINGEFLLETDKLGGEYLITVYEMIEDDSGFDYDAYKLGEYKLSLVDMEEMEGRIITLRFFRDYEKRFLPRKLKESYFVQIEKLECEPDLDSIIGSWSLDFGDEKTLKKCTFYRGTLMHVEGRQSQKDFDVLVIFYSKHEIDKFVILRLFEAEYVELLYDRKTETLLYDDSNLNRRQKFERVLVLEDDKYECVSEFSAKT